MEIGVDVLLNLLDNSHEVFHVSVVGDVQVEIILEVLNHIHVVVDVVVVVASNSWEREGLVIKFPGMDIHFRRISTDSFSNVLGIGPVSSSEGS